MTRKVIAIAALVVALTIPGVPVVAEDGASSATCPDMMSGAEFGTHTADMGRMGHMGADMNVGMHQGYGPMAR